jgi:hypothetical protein
MLSSGFAFTVRWCVILVSPYLALLCFVVGLVTATRLQAGRLGFWILVGARWFSPKCPGWLWGLPSLLCSGYGVSFLGVRWPGYEVNYSPPSNAEVKIGWNSSVSPVCLLGMDNGNFYLDVCLLKCVPY